MVYKIIIGRDDSDRVKIGEKGIIFLGKHYVRMGQTTSLSNEVYLDVVRPHVVLVCGKRGSGKSTTLGVIAEEMVKLDKEVANKLAILIIDTMGIFWTMKFPNSRDEDLLEQWNLKPSNFEVDIYTPSGYFKKYKASGIPTDFSFSIKVSELNASDWCNVFDIDFNSELGVFIEKIIEDLRDSGKDYGMDLILSKIKKDSKVSKLTKDQAENRFQAAKSWGLFTEEGTEIKDIVKGGKVSIIDVSCYTNISGNWGIKNLVMGIIGKRLLEERTTSRKLEELKAVQTRESYFSEFEAKDEKPLIWIMIDEAAEFLPREGKTAATDSLSQLLREGRQPGISLILATQQPGEIHRDVITQSDIIISHRITARRDINALNNMMQSYLFDDILKYLNQLPKLKGSAIILDDNSERLYPMRVRPRLSWHGGESPSAIKIRRKELIDLGIE